MTITAKQLIEALQRFDTDQPVVFAIKQTNKRGSVIDVPLGDVVDTWGDMRSNGVEIRIDVRLPEGCSVMNRKIKK